MTSDRYETQVVAALRAVQLRPPDAFLWFGRRETVRDGDGGEPRERLLQHIARRLHRDFFSAAAPRPRRGGPMTASDDGGAFVRALSQANGGRGAWEGGWRLVEVGADAALSVMRPDGFVLVAPGEDVRAEDTVAGGGLAQGAQVSVRVPKELRGFSPGFYVALGDAGVPAGDDRVGLYWNIGAAGAVTLVARFTYALNGAGLPFSFELLDNPARLGRGDAAVLTVARSDFTTAIKLARPLLRPLGAHLGDAAPAFTKPLARGLAVAEPPAGGERFGAQCCRLLAEAIVAAGEAGAHSTEARTDAVRERFAAAGMSLDAPYLQPGSPDAYALS